MTRKSKGGGKRRRRREEKKTNHKRGQPTQMAGRGARQTDRRVKAVQERQTGGWGGVKRDRGGRGGRKMSLVAFVAPSGDVMFAMSLGLSGHPSTPPPPLLPPSIHRCSFPPPHLSFQPFSSQDSDNNQPCLLLLVVRSGLSCQSNRLATPLILKASEEPLALNTDSSAWRCAEARKRRSEQLHGGFTSSP